MLDPFVVPQFTLDEVARACRVEGAADGVDATTLAQQIHRGHIALSNPAADEPQKPGTGRRRLFSPLRALHIAITQEIAAYGLPVRTASELALKYTDKSYESEDGETPMKATIVGEPRVEPRFPGHQFSRGITGISIVRDYSGLQASVVRLDMINPGETSSNLLINITRLEAEFFARLGFTRRPRRTFVESGQ